MSNEHPKSINIGIGQLVVTAPERPNAYYRTNRAKSINPSLDGLVTLEELEQLAQWVKDERATLKQSDAAAAAAEAVRAQREKSTRELITYHENMVVHYKARLSALSKPTTFYGNSYSSSKG